MLFGHERIPSVDGKVWITTSSLQLVHRQPIRLTDTLHVVRVRCDVSRRWTPQLRVRRVFGVGSNVWLRLRHQRDALRGGHSSRFRDAFIPPKIARP